MNTQNEPQPAVPSSTSTLAIISVVLAAGWIAFAYYKGTAESGHIFLLHPIVPIALVVLLTRVYRHIDLKSIIVLEILMIGIWVFIRLLGTLTPFILGFGFAYIFRFLWNMLPFKAKSLRGLATVAILLVCGALFYYTGRQVTKQAGQMGGGLLKFYHETVLPYVVGETFEAVAIHVEDGEPSAETFYLGTNHGVYEVRQDVETVFARNGITNGSLVGKRIHALATTAHALYAGTQKGVYRYYTADTEAEAERVRNTYGVRPKTWHKVAGTPFDAISIRALNVPSWDRTQIYVGTQQGLYRSQDSGQTWEAVAPELYETREVISIAAGNRTVYVASRALVEMTPSEEADAPPTPTQVHRYSEESASEWSPLPPTPYQVYTLAAGDDPHERYAGTLDGLYTWDQLIGWEKLDNTEAVTLLAAAPSGVYKGDKTVILHQADAAAGWHPFATRDEGVSYTYRNEPIVQQARAYLTERIPTLAQTGSEAIREGILFAGSIAFGFGGFLATLSLSFIVFVYASQSFDNYFRSFIGLVPEQHREKAKTYLREIDRNLQQFLKGQAAVIAMVSVISCLAYSLIGVPFALVVGLLAGICNAIPTFGPFIGGGFAYIAMLMGLAAGDFGLVDFLIRCAFVLGAILGIQTVDNSLISPKIMSSAVNVDPLLIMFAVIVGATVLGFWGVLLAIPIIVVIKSVIAVSQSVVPDPNGLERDL